VQSLAGPKSTRRRIPSEVALAEVSWSWSEPPRTVGDFLVVPAGASLLAVGLGLLLLGRAPASVREHTVVWIEESPPPAVHTPVEEAPPPPPALPEREATPPTPSAPVPLESVQSPVVPSTDPAFGLDDAVETGGMAVASGSTLAKAQDAVVRAPEPPAGPVLVEAVPASVRPVVPRYPPRAEEMGMEANVVVLVTTDASGNVVDLRIEKSGGREFDESVRRAVLATRFVVPLRDGKAQAIAFRLPYRFRLD
jgi:periplasmic protein TonB